MDEDKDLLAGLAAQFTGADEPEITPVRGMVDECHMIRERDRKIYIVHLRNGSLSSCFWVAQTRHDALFDPPRKGDHVSGVVNTLDDNVEFCGQVYKPLFDFTNHSTHSERAAFAWFAKQAEEQRKKDGGGPEPV